MDLFKIIEEAKAVADAVKNGKFIEAWKKSIDLQKSAIEVIEGFGGGKVFAEVPGGDPADGTTGLDAAIRQLDECCQSGGVREIPNVPGAGRTTTSTPPERDSTGAVMFDPASILAIIQAVAAILKIIRDRRNRPQPNPPQ